MKPARQAIMTGYLIFFACIGICTAIMPHFLFERNEGGMSNYGVHASTVIFYTIAFMAIILYLLRARSFLSKTKDYRSLKVVLAVTAASLFVLLLSTYPYKVNNFLDGVHVDAGIWCESFELFAGVWIAVFFRRTRRNLSILSLQFTTFGLSVLTYLSVIDILFVTQLLTVLSFGLLLLSALSPEQKKISTLS
jgi:hypothetical protein